MCTHDKPSITAAGSFCRHHLARAEDGSIYHARDSEDAAHNGTQVREE